MSKNITATINDHFVKGQTLAAIKCGCICQLQRELFVMDGV